MSGSVANTRGRDGEVDWGRAKNASPEKEDKACRGRI